MQAPTFITDREQQDWVTFFKEARYMSEDDVKSKIKTPAVLQAFDRAKISKLPTDVQAAYEAEDKEYDRYSQHTAEQVKKGEIAASERIAKNLIKNPKLNDQEISDASGLPLDEVKKLRN